MFFTEIDSTFFFNEFKNYIIKKNDKKEFALKRKISKLLPPIKQDIATKKIIKK